MKIDNLSYEETVNKLERILDELEKDEHSLSKSMSKFKQGIALYNHCNMLLSEAEGDIKILLEDHSGNITEEEFLMEG